MTKCCLCGQEFDGFGNNPWPLNNDENARCCDKCNAEKVIPARIMQAYSKKEIKEGEEVLSIDSKTVSLVNAISFDSGRLQKELTYAEPNLEQVKYWANEIEAESTELYGLFQQALSNKGTIKEEEEPIEAIGFRVYITYEDGPGVYHSELYKEEYTEDIDRANDIVAELRAQGLHASYEIIWNKEEDPNYDKDVDETNYAAEEEADATDRLENKYGRVDEAEDSNFYGCESYKQAAEQAAKEIFDTMTDDIFLNSTSCIQDETEIKATLNVSAYGYNGEDEEDMEMNRDVEFTIPLDYTSDGEDMSIDEFYEVISEQIKTWIEEHNSPENFYEAEDNSSNEYEKMKEIYMMDRVIRALNDEDALYNYGWLYNVEDEDTDRGFEYFYEENKSEGDWKNTYTTPFKHADGSEDESVYDVCKRLFKEILNEPDIAASGILTRHWFDTHGGRSRWKALSGATPEEVEFAKSVNPNIKVID